MATRIPFFIVALFFHFDAQACSCMLPTIEDQFNSSKYALLVEITSARLVESGEPPHPSHDGLEEIVVTSEYRTPYSRSVYATFRTIESFKTSDEPLEQLFAHSGMCGSAEVSVGATYLVFTNDGQLHFFCMGARELNVYAPEHRAILEALRKIAANGV